MKKIILTLIVFLVFIGKSHASITTIEMFESCNRALEWQNRPEEEKLQEKIIEKKRQVTSAKKNYYAIHTARCVGFLSFFEFIQLAENCLGKGHLKSKIDIFLDHIKDNPHLNETPAYLGLQFAILDYYGCESRINPMILED